MYLLAVCIQEPGCAIEKTFNVPHNYFHSALLSLCITWQEYSYSNPFPRIFDTHVKGNYVGQLSITYWWWASFLMAGTLI